MAHHSLITLSGDELSEQSERWNDLWLRSRTTQPTVRAEAIVQWLHAFASTKRLRAFAVESDGRLVAALPLMRRALGGVYPVYQMPVNCWANCGDLLLDPAEDARLVLKALLQGVRQAGISLLMLDEIDLDADRWQLFRQEVDTDGQFHLAAQHPVGVIDILHDWEAYEASWPKKYRSSMRRNLKKLHALGEVTVHCQRDWTEASVEEQMRTAFEIEDRSWKGDYGSSIVKTPGMADYMISEAQAIASAGMLDLWWIRLNGEPIAFEYCHFSKGVCYSQKIGFDSAYRKYAPGKLLKYYQLKQYHQEAECKLLDMLGTFDTAKAKWATRTYLAGRMYAAIGGPISNFCVRGYAWAKPLLGRLRPASECPAETFQPAAAGCLNQA